jgi:superfamily II DNA/RNA helicase
MNPFKVFTEVKKQYKSYIQTFQIFRNKEIETFVHDQIDHGNMLWQEPIIQISKKFKAGEKLKNYCNEGKLHKDVEQVFKIKDNDGNVFPIHPHLHQQQAIDIISLKDKNAIITTGTGSGKSMCFEIPIVNHCLKQRDAGKKGIKAIIIYPMNALANSQYLDLAELLDGSGLTIGLYTGDTDVSPESALENYKKVFGEEAVPKDCEIISRTQMKKNPPDILLTNYVQLELLLTRLEDKPLFRDDFKDNLKFLVLDELHTYSGKQGADVAFLVRRLKQRTNTIGKLTCIGTSATMVSDKSDGESTQAVADFASKMFGEPFEAENVVTETEDPSLEFDGETIAKEFSVTSTDIDALDYTEYRTALALFKSVMGFDFTGSTKLEMGEVLRDSLLLTYLERELKEVKDLGSLALKYKESHRSQLSLDECKLELIAGLLLGIVGTIKTEAGKEVSRFIPKLHAFYNQGSELHGCLDPDCSYLSHTGEITCPACEDEDRGEKTLYPLHFCRVCGQEYYGVAWDTKGNVTSPWTFMDYDSEGQTGYYSPSIRCEDNMLPDNWFTPKNKDRSKKHKHKFPTNGVLNSENNSFIEYWEDETKLGVFIPHPLPLCLHCLTEHRGATSEYTKMFLLNSVGRATGTDVLTTTTINNSPEREKKLIGFSDNRQDTAFQAGHLNHWYSQIYFRRIFYRVLHDHHDEIFVKDLPAKLYPLIVDDSSFPPRMRRLIKENYESYLETFLFVEIRGTKKFTSINLEDVGLMEVQYDSLDESLLDENIRKYKTLSALNSDLRFDLVKGFFEIFRQEVAVGHPYLIDKTSLRTITNFIDQHIPEMRIFEAVEETQVSIFSNALKEHFRKSNYTHHSLRGSFIIKNWIKKCLPEQYHDNTEAIIDEIVAFAMENMYLQKDTFNHKDLYYLDPQAIMVKAIEDKFKYECPQCHSQYNWREAKSCLKNKCSQELKEAEIKEDFYYLQYTQDVSGSEIIVSEDHSAQVSGQERKDKENRFKKNPPEINILFATPTMELGIDIGTLSSVYMRNVPPNPSNYAQRAGRAGRSGQGSIIQTFCGSGPGRGAHDQYFFNHPIEIVSGKISIPRFNLDNKSLFLSHINALILQTLDIKFPYAAEDIINFLDTELEIKESLVDEFSEALNNDHANIIYNVNEAFKKEMSDFKTIPRSAIEKQVDDFIINLDEVLNILRGDYKETKDEIEYLTKEIQERGQAHNWQMISRREALEKRNENIRKGKSDFYMYRFLSQVGFLPNYAFPTNVKSVKFQHKKEEKEIVRDQIVALREFSPYNTIYYSGQKFVVSLVSRESDINSISKILICEFCDHLEEIIEGKLYPTNCKSCGNVYATRQVVNAIQFPRMHAIRRMRITAEEEERAKGGYKIIHSYNKSSKAVCQNLIKNDVEFARLSFERTAFFKHLNLGAHNEINDGKIGYNLDSINRRWISSDEKKVEKHLEDYKVSSNDIFRQVTLLAESKNDVITIEYSGISITQIEEFNLTLLNTMLQSICNVLNLDDSEIRGYYQPIKDQNGRLVIFETSQGGTGTLSSIVESKDLIHKIAKKSLEILHYGIDGSDLSGACSKSCYNCICNFYNQRNHTDFDRKLVKEFLIDLTTFDELSQSQDEAILFDEYINDEKTSSLEKLVLTRLYSYGMPMPKEIHKIIFRKDEPVVEADFFYEPKLCVFIDGPDHDKQHIMDSDERKRKKLKMLNYKYNVVHHTSLEEDIDKLLIELGAKEGEIKAIEYPCSIYLDTKDQELANKYFYSLQDLLESYGLSITDLSLWDKGSLKRYFKATFRSIGDIFPQDDVLRKLKHGTELATIQKSQSEANKNNYEAASKFIQASKDIKNISTLIGSLAIVKLTGQNGESELRIIELTTEQVIYLQDNPRLRSNPKLLLESIEKQ